MNDVRTMAQNYLAEAPVLHLATVLDNKPWSVPVYFVADDELNLYWLSEPDRRLSRMLAQNPHVAGSIAVKVDKPVIGIDAEGLAEEITDLELVRTVMTQYVAKYDAGHRFAERFAGGENRHRLYRLAVERMVLFDEVNFREPQLVLGTPVAEP